VKVTGCTVHLVTDAVDAGPIILQAAVPVYDDDSEETLAERIHKEEHRILIEAITLFAEGRLKVEGRKVTSIDAGRRTMDDGRWTTADRN
jgi:phosphoribosylglycinamide formyltransferase-1